MSSSSRVRKRPLWRGQKCHYCDAPATTQDHIVPLSKGGTYVRWNLVPACKPCNEKKADAWPTCECFTCTYAKVWDGGAPLI